MSSGVAVYPTAAAVPIGNMISNTVENVGFSIYSSDEDDDAFDCDTDVANSPSRIIAEAESLLMSQSPNEEDMPDLRRSPVNKMTQQKFNDDFQTKDRITNSCLTSSTSKPPRMKKFVTFNMELNETHEYDSGDEKPMETEEDCRLADQVLDAGDLFDSDSEEEDRDESGKKDRVRVAFGSTDVLTFTNDEDVQEEEFDTEDSKSYTGDMLLRDDILSLSREKSGLEEEIRLLHEEYETEMQRLREEYETRREDYLTELETFRSNIDKERSQYEDENMDGLVDETDIRERRLKLDEERMKLDELEEDLQRKRQQCAEQDQEIQEYERYLNRRHTTLNDKEEDLKVLQEELEELSRALRKRERELKQKQERLDSNDTEHRLRRVSTEQVVELNDLRSKMEDLNHELMKQKKEVEEKIDENETLEHKALTLDSENKKLQQKIKHLETQLTVGIKLQEPKQDSHYIRRTSVMLAQQTSVENGDLLSSSRLLERPSSSKSIQSNRSSGFHSQKSERKGDKLKENSQTTKVDSRTNVSKTCTLM